MARWFTNLGIIPGPDAATLAWVTAVGGNGGSVSGARQTLVDNLIVGLKADGVWSKLDRLWLFAAENAASALTDIVATDLATSVNSTSFTTDRGYTSDGSTSYIDSTFNPVTNGVNYTNSAASVHIWSNTDRASSGLSCTGAFESGPDRNMNLITFQSNQLQGRFNGSGVNIFTNTSSIGLFTFNRSSSGDTNTDVQTYRNGTALTFVSGGTSTVSSNLSYFICAPNIDGSPGGKTTDQLSAAAYGGSLTSTEAGNFYARLRTYMTAVGVP